MGDAAAAVGDVDWVGGGPGVLELRVMSSSGPAVDTGAKYRPPHMRDYTLRRWSQFLIVIVFVIVVAKN